MSTNSRPMRSAIDDILWSGIYDDLDAAFIEQLVRRGGVDDPILVRQVAQDAAKRLIREGLAVVGYGAGKAGNALQSPDEAMAAFEEHQADWNRDGAACGFVLSLTPMGNAAGRAVQAERERLERAVLRSLATRFPEIAGPLDVASDGDIRRMRLADLSHEANTGKPPAYRDPIPTGHFHAIFAALEEIFVASDSATQEVILDWVPYVDITGSLLPFLGPALRAEAIAHHARVGYSTE